MFIDGRKVPEIRQRVNEIAPLPVSASTITKRLIQWGLHKPTKRKGASNLSILTVKGLDAYKVQLLAWNKDGRTIPEIHGLFQDQFGENTSQKLLTKALDHWQEPASVWRGINQNPSHFVLPIPLLPVNILSREQQAVLREGIRASYLESQHSSSNQENDPYDQFVPQQDKAMMEGDVAQRYGRSARPPDTIFGNKL